MRAVRVNQNSPVVAAKQQAESDYKASDSGDNSL